MSTEQDRALNRSVNAEEPVYDSDPPPTETGMDRPTDNRPGPVVAGRTAHMVEDGEYETTPLLDQHDLDRFHTQWRELQGAFVDSPQEAVTKADSLVTEALERLTASLSQRKQKLDDQWSRGEDGDTEELRMVLRGYREYLDRLLAI
ncbi:hypothetical protein ACFROC_29920 [Nocardia tengchongensis]|uniref:hypothetical protein n=1 Tax=Nocardia tengchongensis TaxID=2055889 RepID=UPI0036A8731B